MFTTSDNKSLRRGRRRAPRTEVCRPCLVWLAGVEQQKMQGVLLDLNPHGMRVRMLEMIPLGTSLEVQMMRDEEFRFPLSQPIKVEVVRVETDEMGFIDHGVRVRLAPIKKPEEIKPVRLDRPKLLPRTFGKMHNMDYTIGDRGIRRPGRGRG